MTNYWEPQFLQHLNKEDIKNVFEVGARTGEESIELSKIFDSSNIYSFECNPLVSEKTKKALDGYENIHFYAHGFGDKNEELPFYSYREDNVGASSLFKRFDFEKTQHESGKVIIKKLKDFVNENQIHKIDLFCMDVQGYELNVLKGAEDFIKKIKYIILEQPKTNNVSYIGAPDASEIVDFMTKNNFKEIERLQENLIEDNVMYINLNEGL